MNRFSGIRFAQRIELFSIGSEFGFQDGFTGPPVHVGDPLFDRRNFCIDVLVVLLDRRALGGRHVEHAALHNVRIPGIYRLPVFWIVGGRETAHHPVVIDLCQWIEFVIVAPRAMHGDSQQTGIHDLDRVVHDFKHVEFDKALRFVRKIRCGAQEARRDQGLPYFVRVPLGVPPVDEFVARQLFSHKSVVGLVFVECIDDVMSVSPLALGNQDQICVLVETGGVHIPDDVQPVSSPALAERRCCEQPIDHAFMCVG